MALKTKTKSELAVDLSQLVCEHNYFIDIRSEIAAENPNLQFFSLKNIF